MDTEVLVEGAESTTATAHDLPKLESFSPEQRQEWLLKGTPFNPPVEDSEPTTEEHSAEKSEIEPVPEPGFKQEQPKKETAETRKLKLMEEIRELSAKKNALKAEVEGKGVKEAEKPPVESPVTDLAEPVEPDLNTFTGTWDEFQAAQKVYRQEYKKWFQAETQRTVEAEFNSRQKLENLKAQWNEGVKVHPTLPEMAKVVMSSASEDFQRALLGLKDWAQLTVYLGANPEELKTITEAYAAGQSEALVALGEVRAKLKDADPKKVPALVETTKAPRPPADITGHKTAPEDPIRAAIMAGDQETYVRLANARDLRKRA